jgi:hypothetical protein
MPSGSGSGTTARIRRETGRLYQTVSFARPCFADRAGVSSREVIHSVAQCRGN